ncbi:hypothetical protein [Radicibacter daui]|uniref:hypothetical protein n=1 Tax=Radicibacter daui TaxID=3064829 RepID=UPI004046F5EF
MPYHQAPATEWYSARQITKLIAASAFLALTGCAFLINTHVDDLKLNGVSLVDVTKIARDFPAHSQRKVLLISLFSQSNIAQISASHDLNNLGANVGFCHTSQIATRSRIYQAGHQLGPFLDESEKRKLATEELSKNGYIYEIWLDYRTLGRRSGGDAVDYDLSINPKDLCIVIQGNPYMAVGTGLITNTVVIPKQMIMAALRQE